MEHCITSGKFTKEKDGAVYWGYEYTKERFHLNGNIQWNYRF